MATVGGQVQPAVCTISSAGKRSDTLRERDARIQFIVAAVVTAARGADLVVVEGPSILSRGGSNWDRAGLWWCTVAALCRLIPVAVAPPTVVKKFAAGKGNADKASVAAGITRLWPGVEPGNDNEFDALALATIGAQRLDLPVPVRAHHTECLGKVEWPEDTPPVPDVLSSDEDRRWLELDTRAERTADAATSLENR